MHERVWVLLAIAAGKYGAQRVVVVIRRLNGAAGQTRPQIVQHTSNSGICHC